MKLKIKGKLREVRFGLGFMDRAIKTEEPENNDIMQLPTQKLIFHALAYADEYNQVDPQTTMFDVFDYLDSVGLNSDEVKNFQVAFFNSMRNHMPDNESKKAIDEVVKALTPAEKKKVSKSGAKTGK